MKKLFVLLATAVMMSVGTNSFAQFMGGNGGNHRIASSDSFTTFWLGYAPTSWKTGDTSESGYNTFSMGITSMFPLSGSAVCFETGAYVDWMNKSKSNRTFNFVDVKIPFNLLYPIALADGITFYPYAGLNVRGYVIGKRTYKSSSETSDSYEYFGGENKYYNRFGLGYQVGLSAHISSVFVRIGYEDMLTSIHKDTSQKINYLTLCLGIPF